MYQVLWMTLGQDGLATLISGILAFIVGVTAVVGAVVVGLRQAAIQRGQLELQALTLKADLFDRRVAVYDAVQRWLGYFDFYHKIPGFSLGDDAPTEQEREISHDFWKAMDRAQFLFPPDIHNELSRIRELGRRWRIASRALDRMQRIPSAELSVAIQREDEMTGELEQAIKNLAETFADDLRLGIDREVNR